MPRTKISKNKRSPDSRNEELEEQLRLIDLREKEGLAKLESKYRENLELLLSAFDKLRCGLSSSVLSMKLGDLMAINLETSDEDEEQICKSENTASSSLSSNQQAKSEDKGYFTEDATGSVKSSLSSGTSHVSRHDSRPLGPLSLAKTKQKHRRSRSASTYFLNDGNTSQNKRSNLPSGSNSNISNSEKGSKIRTMSVDRTAVVKPKITPNTPLSILRYPRIGETVISLTGSPVVVQSMPESTANVNIPLRDRVISLRPTKMNEVDDKIVTQIDRETINQIKQLQTNLNLIIDFASKQGL